MSILSFPDRGKWGRSDWIGNCSGHVYRELFTWLTPDVFVDPMAGSMTSVEVAKEMGIEAHGLDLHSGFNILKNRIVEAVGKESDLVFSHPPYGSMLVYSGNMYGEPHPDDLSRCEDDEDFHEKLQLAMLNQREATKNGGYYGILIGDWRRAGVYTSYQAEAIARMPSKELASVIIKAQHNTNSGRRSYGKMKLPFVMHEYLILWQKKGVDMFSLLQSLANEQRARSSGTWRMVIRMALTRLGGKASLSEIYAAVFDTASDKTRSNPHWQAKVRQTLQLHGDFISAERGVWQVA